MSPSPTPLAALKNARPTIGLLIASLASAYQARIVQGAADYARARDCNLIVFSGGPFGSPDPVSMFRERIFELADKSALDGIIIPMGSLSRYISREAARQVLQRFDPLPVVTIVSDVEGYTNISLDNASGMVAMVNHLVSVHGLRRFAFARGHKEHLSSNQKMDAFRAALSAHGISFDESMVLYSDLKKNAWVMGVEALMAHPEGPPQAIVSINDNQAMVIIEQLQNLGLRVPQDVAVTGCMGTDEGLFFDPPLSSVDEPNYDLGWYAAEAVIDAIEGRPRTSAPTLPTRVLIRRSCGCGDTTLPDSNPQTAQPASSLENLLSGLRESVCEAHGQLLLEAREQVSKAMVHRLIDQLQAELAGQETGAFLSNMRQLLFHSSKAEVLNAWARMALHIHAFLVTLPEPAPARLAKALLDLLQSANERFILNRGYEVEKYVSLMREIGLELNASFDVNQIGRLLGRELHIQDCYVNVFTQAGQILGPSVNLMAMRAGKVLTLQNAACGPGQLMPPEVPPYTDTYALLILPLSFRDQLLGLLTLSVGDLRGMLYESLRTMLGGALQHRLQLSELREAEEKFSDIALSASDWLWELDADGRFIYSSDGAQRVLGYAADALRGRLMFDFFINNEALDSLEARERMLDHAGFTNLEFTLRHREGQRRVLKASGKPVIKAGTIVGYRGAFKDVTEVQQQEARIRALAYRDQLTNLPNRTLFNDRLLLAMAAAQRDDYQFAILFLDLDGFKLVNDSMGHEAGDQLLRAVAQRLQECVRDVDTLARFGGDEFIIALPRIEGLEDAAHVAQRIVSAFEQAFDIRGQQIFITTSVGIARFPQDGDNAESLLKNADKAMYKAKEQGKNRFTLYDGELEEDLLRTVALRELVRTSLRQQRFYLLFQPQIEAHSRRVIGVEALIRVAVEAGPYISPAEFIPIAEDMGLIDEIGLWVFEQVCRQQVLWAAQGHVVNCSFNVSAKQLRKRDLAEQFIAIMRKHGARPEQLTLEITESAVIDTVDTARRSLQRLADCGMGIAIDDFGTGYASLSVLRKFPVSVVKIDRSFINECVASEEGANMVWAIVLMAKSLNMTIVAEGVETEDQAGFLQSVGCQRMQGFFFARPMAAADIPGFSQLFTPPSSSRPQR